MKSECVVRSCSFVTWLEHLGVVEVKQLPLVLLVCWANSAWLRK